MKILRVDTAPHGVETPTQATLLLIVVRQASGQIHEPSSNAVHLPVVNDDVVVRSTWISMYNLRLAQPNKKK